MIMMGANGQKIAYGIKHYNLDDENDLKALPVDFEVMGCTAFVISTSKYYMLNSSKEWIQISPYGNMTGSGGGAEMPKDVISEGGVI